MSNRESYEKIPVEEFKEELERDLRDFLINMKHLNAMEDSSFPEWHEMFAAWLEVGTNEEEMTYHRTGFCTNKKCKFC